MEFNYEVEEITYNCLTKCPCFPNKSNIMVGSVFCVGTCIYFISRDKKNQIIYCKGKKIIEENNG